MDIPPPLLKVLLLSTLVVAMIAWAEGRRDEASCPEGVRLEAMIPLIIEELHPPVEGRWKLRPPPEPALERQEAKDEEAMRRQLLG